MTAGTGSSKPTDISTHPGTNTSKPFVSDLLQMLHKGLVLAHRVGRLLHDLGHVCWCHQKFGHLHSWIGGLGRFRRRLQDCDYRRRRRGLQTCRGGLHRDVPENVSIGLENQREIKLYNPSKASLLWGNAALEEIDLKRWEVLFKNNITDT